MKRILFFTLIISGLLVIEGCGPSRRFGTTIERDEQNPCIINMVIQVAIQGTDADVATVKKILEDCYNKECFIPCSPDSSKGCKTKITVVVKKFGELKEEEQNAYHYVLMVDDDSLPSNAYLGTPNNGASSGEWRRNQLGTTYCHEVLHFCGLPDRYCSRIYDPVLDSIITENVCDPPPEPNGNCCTPGPSYKRCCNACAGYENDIMGAYGAPMRCENIRNVLKNSGFDNCPQECCNSGSTFTRPPPEYNFTPGYYRFGDKSTKFGSIGISTGYTTSITPSIGVTIDGGYYTHTDKQNNFKETSSLSHITAGITYIPKNIVPAGSGLSIITRLLAGISSYRQKVTSGQSNFSTSEKSLQLDIGAALHMFLNRSFNLRILGVDYAPTFFYKDVQHNLRVGAGLVYKINR